VTDVDRTNDKQTRGKTSWQVSARADALQQQLAEVLKDDRDMRAALAQTQSKAQRLAMRFVRRHRGSVLSAAATALLLILTTAAALWQAQAARRERGAARRCI
jgi:hypothetical protein